VIDWTVFLTAKNPKKRGEKCQTLPDPLLERGGGGGAPRRLDEDVEECFVQHAPRQHPIEQPQLHVLRQGRYGVAGQGADVGEENPKAELQQRRHHQIVVLTLSAPVILLSLFPFLRSTS
jgi:hypothetical protein